MQANQMADVAEPTYMVFLSSPSLYEKARRYIEDTESLSIDGRRALMVDISLQFTDESLQAQFLNYLDLLSVRSGLQKAVIACVTTIKKASEPLIRKLAASLSAEELNILANYMDTVIVGEQEGRGYIGYPVTPEVMAGFEAVFTGVKAGKGPEQIDLFQHTLIEMTRCAYYTFFEQPLGLLKLGLVKRKLTDVALKVCRSATLTLIGTVFKGMPQQELEAVVGYLESMIYERESSG